MWIRKHRSLVYSYTDKRYTIKYNVTQCRNYSQFTNDKHKESVIPVVIYSDASTDKSIILKDNKNKAGIYRWVNKENGNCYVGSSENLTDRFRKYYSFRNISLELLKGKSLIYSAIVKYGLKNFKVEILEYCAAENAISREQYYLDLLKPKYNILTIAGSRLGHIHSE